MSLRNLFVKSLRNYYIIKKYQLYVINAVPHFDRNNCGKDQSAVSGKQLRHVFFNYYSWCIFDPLPADFLALYCCPLSSLDLPDQG